MRNWRDWFTIEETVPPRCSYREPFGVQCSLDSGHRGTCMTRHGRNTNFWYGINYIDGGKYRYRKDLKQKRWRVYWGPLRGEH